MHSRVIHDRRLGAITLRPLRSGELVAYAEGDPSPAGTAQLVRDPSRRTHATIVCAMADRYRDSGIQRALVELLAADARAAGVTHLTGPPDNLDLASHATGERVVAVLLEAG